MEEYKIQKIYYQDELKNVPFSLHLNPFERAGYKFEGWAENPDSTEITYSDGESFLKGISENKTLYAVWSPLTLTFTFDANGGGFQDYNGSVYVKNNITFGTFPELDSKYLSPIRDGYEFKGWYNQSGGERINSWNFYAQDNLDVFAKWTKIGEQDSPDPIQPQPPSPSIPEPEKPTSYNIVSPVEDENNKFTNVSGTTSGSKTYLRLRFRSSPGYYYHDGYTCSTYTTYIYSSVYTCEQFPDETYFKIQILPGVDRIGQNKGVKVWGASQQAGYKFLGWNLTDSNYVYYPGQPLSAEDERTYYYCNTPWVRQDVYVNTKAMQKMCIDGCCNTKAFVFKAKWGLETT